VRALWEKTWRLLLRDYTAMGLVLGNIASVIWVLVLDDWWSSILILFALELLVIGFYTTIRFPFIHRVGGTLIMPLFGAIYLALVQIFLFLPGIVLEAENGGPFRKGEFDFDGYVAGLAIATIPLFVSHGVSFLANFVGDRQWQTMTVEQNLLRGFARAMPIVVISIPVCALVLITDVAVVAILLMVPIKIGWDLIVHFQVNGSWTDWEADR
jgi:hypothetical protein